MAEEIIFENTAEKEIWECCQLDNPRSFFLFAGAGSGKTRSLINILKLIRENYGAELRVKRKKIGVITYTNAACEEIRHRLGYDSHFSVSTIHSFAWELINHFQGDIKKWVRETTAQDIIDIQETMRKGRAGTHAARDRENRLERKRQRLANIDHIKQFVYSPTGDNTTKDSLNHTEVIQLTASFLSKPLMQQLVVQQYPILFIDESQDTNKELIDALFQLQIAHSRYFLLGLFGDTMQRIYNDGKPNIENELPPDWALPIKRINYRSPKRVVELINKIRSAVDDKLQEANEGQVEGHARIFITDKITDKAAIEVLVTEKMKGITADPLWGEAGSNVKVLILEHHMAARRMGFLNFYAPLYEAESIRTGLLNGTLSGIKFLTVVILPLVKASKVNDDFVITRIVKEHSIFFQGKKSPKSNEQITLIERAQLAVKSLLSLWIDGHTPKLIEIVRNVGDSGLFILPESLALIYARQRDELVLTETEATSDEEIAPVIKAWDSALKVSFHEIEKYNEYITENPRFGTHQGVKGLEFDRVMVVIDDEEARGFSFKYQTLFADQTIGSNRSESGESGIDRTRRLFYVTCSRARKSLAVVAYTKDVRSLRQSLLNKDWFMEDEIITL